MKTIAMAFLILTLPVLLSRPPDPGTVQGHLATCAKCSNLEANPARCGEAMAVVWRNYKGRR